MGFEETIKIIYRKKWLIFWLTVLGAVLAFNLAVIQTPQYKASFKMLVIQKQVVGQDIYSISKSAQYLCRVLKEGIYSDSFFEKVLQSPYKVEAADFPVQLKERRKEWQRDVKVRIVRDLGVIEVDVFYPQKEKAEQITQATADVLEKNHRFYHGGGQNVELKVLDKPLVSQQPDTLHLWFGSILGALIGFLAGLAWVLRKKPEVTSNGKETSSLDGSNPSI
jgi:capsular polysaccharide biosynthesis protein